MSRSKLETLKTILTSEYWLIASLCGAFFSFFALNRGGAVVFIDACAVFLLINLITGRYSLKSIPKSHLVTLAICVYLLGTSILFSLKTSHYRWMAYMIRMLCLVFAIHCLSHKGIKDWVANLFIIVLSVAVCWQAASYHIFRMPWGTFSNPHLLSSFSMAALPVIIYALIVTRRWYKFCLLPVAFLDIDLLLRIKSRPAVLGVVVGAVFVFIFMVKGWRKWASLLLVGCTLLVMYLTDYGNVYSRFEELIINFSTEERLPLWTAAWNMLKDNSLTAWVFGNGIGGGRSVIPEYIPDPRLKTLIFSHNYLLEICFENGVIGVILVFGGIGSLLFYAIRTARQTDNKNRRILISCMVAAFISWLIHAGLTIPFYSKYSQYSLAFILGTLLASLKRPANKND